MSKSLGEKLNDAFRANHVILPSWSTYPDTNEALCERIALAFCASLSHDETDTATIEALKAERDSLLAALKPFGDIYEHHMTKGKYGPAWGFNDGTLLHEDFARAAALTTTEG